MFWLAVGLLVLAFGVASRPPRSWCWRCGGVTRWRHRGVLGALSGYYCTRALVQYPEQPCDEAYGIKPQPRAFS